MTKGGVCMEQGRADWKFKADALSPLKARTLIAQRLHHLPGEVLETVLLLTSELVTNAVRHGTGPISVHVAWDDEEVRVEVEDLSLGRPVLRAMDPEAPNGRGLILVDRLSSSWGVSAREDGKTVWFTIDA